MSDEAPEPGRMSQSHSQGSLGSQPTTVLPTTGTEPAGWPNARGPEQGLPKKRFQLGRLTQVLLAVLLLAIGFFGGMGVTKLTEAGQTRPARGQFQNQNGGQGRNRQNRTPADGASPSAIPSVQATAAP